MKYIKQYEDINKTEIQLGDYVICKEDVIIDDDADKSHKVMYARTLEFTSNNIGKYVDKEKKSSNLIAIQFENVPIELKEFFSANEKFENCRNMYYREILDFSPDKEYLKVKKDSDKYNL